MESMISKLMIYLIFHSQLINYMPSGNLNNDDYWNYGMRIFNGAYQFRHGDYLRLHPSN